MRLGCVGYEKDGDDDEGLSHWCLFYGWPAAVLSDPFVCRALVASGGTVTGFRTDMGDVCGGLAVGGGDRTGTSHVAPLPRAGFQGYRYSFRDLEVGRQ